jgi:hypothetical protein
MGVKENSTTFKSIGNYHLMKWSPVKSSHENRSSIKEHERVYAASTERDIGLAKTIALIRLRIYDLLPRKIARENWFVGQIFEKSHKL